MICKIISNFYCILDFRYFKKVALFMSYDFRPHHLALLIYKCLIQLYMAIRINV